MHSKKRKNNGLFITFEGIEGCGKSTHIKYLYKFLKKHGFKVIKTKEPGGSSIGKIIRKILLDPKNKNLSPKTELFLLLADRAQHTIEKIKKFLNLGFIVISDRYIDSSIAYQAAGRELNLNFVKKLNKFATDNLVPDLTFLLDIDISKGLKNAKKRKFFFKKVDRFETEKLKFHKKVRDMYYKLLKDEPNRIILIKLKKNPKDTQKIIRKIVLDKINSLNWKIK